MRFPAGYHFEDSKLNPTLTNWMMMVQRKHIRKQAVAWLGGMLGARITWLSLLAAESL
jgi:hypothetical protein